MARLARMNYEGAIYHVTVRGNNRRTLFGDDPDRQQFMERLEVSAKDCGVRVYAFCLMDNHVHLVVETPIANLGRFMHKLETGYAVYFNHRHQESGHLTQGRYGAKVVAADSYLLAVLRYVHLNPVRGEGMEGWSLTERRQRLRTYGWSSYRSYLGRMEWLWVETGPVLAMMGKGSAERRRAEFRRYVESALPATDDEFQAICRGSGLGIGDAEFLATLASRYKETARKRTRAEDVIMRQAGRRVQTEKVVEVTCRYLGVVRGAERERRRGSWTRPILAQMLIRFGGLTQREVAARLGVGTGKAVSAQVQRLCVAIREDQRLQGLVRQLESELGKEPLVAQR